MIVVVVTSYMKDVESSKNICFFSTKLAKTYSPVFHFFHLSEGNSLRERPMFHLFLSLRGLDVSEEYPSTHFSKPLWGSSREKREVVYCFPAIPGIITFLCREWRRDASRWRKIHFPTPWREIVLIILKVNGFYGVFSTIYEIKMAVMICSRAGALRSTHINISSYNFTSLANDGQQYRKYKIIHSSMITKQNAAACQLVPTKWTFNILITGCSV